MKTHLKSILLGCTGILAAGLLVFVFLDGNTDHDPSVGAALPSSSPQLSGSTKQPRVRSEDAPKAALGERSQQDHGKELREWADTVAVGAMAEMLDDLDSIENPESRSQVRQALLESWTERDLRGMVSWFGKRSAADQTHQEARDQLARTLAGQEPSSMISWMEQSLPEIARNEVYGPFFREWASIDPVSAAAKLRELTIASPGNLNVWNDLIGQVASQWANSDLNQAVDWVQTLPEGSAKSRALVQISYRWIETDPLAAAACAKRQNDPKFITAVAGQWAAIDPKSAAKWCEELPASEARDAAAASVAAAWAQKEPKAAAEYAAGLSTEEARNRATLAVSSAWTYDLPAEAAHWVAKAPEGSVREQMLSQLIGSWTEKNADEAGAWLERLPSTPSRDVAVDTYCTRIDKTYPDIAFAWAGTISGEEARNRSLSRAAAVWLMKNPTEARRSILQSNLPEATKSQLLATQPTRPF